MSGPNPMNNYSTVDEIQMASENYWVVIYDSVASFIFDDLLTLEKANVQLFI